MNGQASVAGAAKAIFVIPPGPATVVIANAGTAATAYVSLGGTGVSSTIGFPVPSGLVPPVTFPCYPGSGGGTVYAISASGTTSLAWILSTSTGGTGL